MPLASGSSKLIQTVARAGVTTSSPSSTAQPQRDLDARHADPVQPPSDRGHSILGNVGQPSALTPPKRLRARYEVAVRDEQLYDFERLWYALEDERSTFGRGLIQLIERLGEKYQVDELAARYEFSGRTGLTVAEALEVKAELEKIDQLLKQLEQARDTAQIAVIDLSTMAEFTEPGDIERLQELQRMVENYLRDMAERQGLTTENGAFQLTPQAYRLFQGKLLERIFSNLQASRTGRHTGPVVGEGAVELQQTKPYEFGDSLTTMDIPRLDDQRHAARRRRAPMCMRPDDIEVHRTRNTPKCATVY
jgi:hypothetical protein